MNSVIFVDDEIFALEYLKKKLTGVSFKSYFACSGGEALDILKAHPDIQVVVTDLNMDGMDGFELLKIIRKRYPEMKRIVLSAHKGPHMIKQAIEQGDIDEFLPKPVDVQMHLIPVLETLFRSSS